MLIQVFLSSLFTDNPFTPEPTASCARITLVLIVSDFAAAEFASVIARHVRTRDITPDNTRIAFSTFDAWTSRVTKRAEISLGDVVAAEAFLRRPRPQSADT
jgi:uncharacterized protein